MVESLEKAVGNLFEGVKAPPVVPVEAGPEKLGYAELAARAAAEQQRMEASLEEAWKEVAGVAVDKQVAHQARALVLEKFLADFSKDNRHASDAQDMLARLKAGLEPLVMARIPAGEFFMGCSPGDGECGGYEKPAHKVWVSEFVMDATEVTVAAYKRCVEAGKCSEPKTVGKCTWGAAGKEQHPVNCVDWSQAKGYCEWAGKRLPTEAEWEKAARGGTAGAWYGELDAVAWYVKNSGGGTYPVGKKQPNGYGLYDMLGNVWEWCADWYGEGYYKDSPGRDPVGPDSGEYRVLRGGSWPNVAWSARASARLGNHPGLGDVDFGFRCAGSAAIGP